jgi:rhodanese-related sulfurtransferase
LTYITIWSYIHIIIELTTQVEKSISPRELQCRLAAGKPARLLDVRTSGEYAAGHVPGAKLIPLDKLDPGAFCHERGAANKPLYILCQSGGRARRAIEKLEHAGVQGCVLVEGGTQAWIDAGLPVNRGESKVLPLMRQVQIIVGIVSATGAALALAINPWFAVLPLITGGGLLFAGITGFCGLAQLLAKMPWNRTKSCGCCHATKDETLPSSSVILTEKRLDKQPQPIQ